MKKQLALFLTTLFLVQNSVAATNNTNFTTSATVTGTCMIKVANVNFGEVIPFAKNNAEYPLNISTLCTKGSTALISIQGDPVMTNSKNSDLLSPTIKFGTKSYMFPAHNRNWDSRSFFNYKITGTGNWTTNSDIRYQITQSTGSNVNLSVSPGNYSTTQTLLVTF